MISIVDSISLPGFDDRANEDRFGFTDDAAFVIDGATGLGNPLLTGPGGSDAAWIADFAALGFEAMLAKGGSVVDAVRAVNADVLRLVGLCAPDAPDWALPIAGFQAVTWRNGLLETWGLGDCSLIVIDAAGATWRASGLPGAAERERAETRARSDETGPLNGRQLYEMPDVLAGLREARARFNKPGQPVWTLGASPSAANHVGRMAIHAALPAVGLLATDGFMALVETYGQFDPAGLVAAAENDGLEMIGSLLRQTERVADPECITWPRYKISDDATAILFEIG